MLRISLEQWRMFRAVVEFGGFNQAAIGVHKSQSSIHNAVSKIEDSLGVKLFQIEGRKTVLTPAGQMMLRRANYLLDEAAKIEAVGQTLGEGIEGKLKIAVDEIFPQKLLYTVLDAISIQYPLLQIELVESILTGASELLANKEVDIAISPIALNEGFSEELCQIEFIAVATPTHALHQLNRELTLEDLKSYRQIVVRDSAISRKKDEGWLGANQRWTVSHLRTSVDMISNGFGFAWLPLTSIFNELKSEQLKALPLSHNSKRTTKLHLTFIDGDRLGPAATAFLILLRAQCSNLPSSPHA
ncbi:LysR family transcriptional regulator [Pseudoalteromonas tunicata]|uniref:LysR family transcriptional regulator n=1 Tax=Pseudoalteromonas tunicata TaxID=314281 RepID=UPI00273D00F2|nr:LysR family transcriptional regulator [Pseudoalteromonas tunicata]MDP5213435.1 LysR family transcriptional regulator [Pseudoalteromonas tunicata]